MESPGRILVLTGADIPDDPAADIVVTAWQFREALRQAGKLAEAETAIATMSAQDSAAFATSAVFGRSWPAVVNLKEQDDEHEFGCVRCTCSCQHLLRSLRLSDDNRPAANFIVSA